MKINELQANSKIDSLVGTIMKLWDSEERNGISVQEGIMQDSTGQVKFALWKDQVGKFIEGDKIVISPGWCKEFENVKKVSSGKFGKIKKVPEKEVQ